MPSAPLTRFCRKQTKSGHLWTSRQLIFERTGNVTCRIRGVGQLRADGVRVALVRRKTRERDVQGFKEIL